MQRDLETFVGEAPIAQQHGMTVAELARLLAAEYLPARAGRRLDLSVATMTGWQPDRPGDLGGLGWIRPSPNIPTVETALAYVGTCYFEGTNLSVGRGTSHPFLTVGAPYVDGRWAHALGEARLAGISFTSVGFTPATDVLAGRRCHGVRLTVDDPSSFDAIGTAVTMLTTLRRLYRDFAWRYDTGDPIDPYWIDKLSGSTAVRRGVDAGHSPDTIVRSWAGELRRFEPIRAEYLLYPR